MIIKLGITPKAPKSRMVFQFAHELTHVVFRSYLGIDKPHANVEEETICTAASLMAIKELYPEELSNYSTYKDILESEKYKDGPALAASINYNWNKLKK